MAMPLDVHTVAGYGGDEYRTDDNGDEYWTDDNAAEPVLLVDQAADAITEALYRVRSGASLDDQDVAAAGVALGDLFGGLGELADLLRTSMCRYAEAAPLQAGRLEQALKALRATAQEGKRAADGVHFSGSSIDLTLRRHPR